MSSNRRKRKGTRKQKRGGRNGLRNGSQLIAYKQFNNPVAGALDNRMQFRRQPNVVMRVISGTVPLATTVATGLISYVQTVDPTADIPNWSSRFASLYQKYRLLKVACTATLTSASTGMAAAWFNDESSTPPTFPEAEEQAQNWFPLSNASSRSSHTFMWTATDLNNLFFNDVATSSVSTNFKIFTNAANYGAPITATNVLVMNYTYWLEFRGYSS